MCVTRYDSLLDGAELHEPLILELKQHKSLRPGRLRQQVVTCVVMEV